MAVTGTHFDLKIFVDKEKGRVLFAEAGGEFVDVLFSFLTLPLGTIVRLIGKTQSEASSTLGCFTTLSQSVKNLGNEYFCAEEFKDMLLQPRSSSEVVCRKLKINIDDTEASYFICQSCRSYMSIYKNTRCTSCYRSMSVRKVIPSKDSSKEKIFVTKDSKFIISDDLQVVPVVPGTIMGFLTNLGINDLNSIEGTTVKLGMNELIELLKRAFLSTTPLTDLFLSKIKQHVDNPLPQIPSLHKRDGVARSGEARKIHVKVVLKKSNKEVLFVEAGHDFVDFLFSFLVIPLGEMLHLMEGQSGLDCIDGLYKSAQSLDSQYFISQDVMNNLLRPKLPPLLKRENVLFPMETTELSCSIDGFTRKMPRDSIAFGVASPGLFVRGDETFMVLDNLASTPFSAESFISICNRNKLSLSDLEERTLSLGIEEGISILRASLNSTSAISNGLLHNNLALKEPKQEKFLQQKEGEEVIVL